MACHIPVYWCNMGRDGWPVIYQCTGVIWGEMGGLSYTSVIWGEMGGLSYTSVLV